MRSHSRTYKVSLISALGYLMTFVESKPATITCVTSISLSRCLNTAPRITAPPTSGPTELIKVKRKEFGFDTCAYINDEPLTCAEFGTCTSLSRQSIEYVGCCYGEGDCDIYTDCYDENTPLGTRMTDPRILSCAGTRPFCATVLWPQEPKTVYMCAEQPSTITVDPTTDFATSTANAAPEPTDFETSIAIPAPEPTDGSGGGAIADLTKSQKIGIGVGCGVAGLVFAAGLGYCCCCSKQRRPKNAPKNGIVAVHRVSEYWPDVMESR
ncbi:hypothetical protein BKA59DRAFT_488794 [Fusarium tricinctum]|uniref:Uncharacterized protein n=1 Tax=Fusarium tricinctum TaxID=61284 RepID=A0A8K0RJ52_9HYPO|nr:hypothetical protein BKA59DRAFT_488794 [Fusarium tricinctum]